MSRGPKSKFWKILKGVQLRVDENDSVVLYHMKSCSLINYFCNVSSMKVRALFAVQRIIQKKHAQLGRY